MKRKQLQKHVFTSVERESRSEAGGLWIAAAAAAAAVESSAGYTQHGDRPTADLLPKRAEVMAYQRLADHSPVIGGGTFTTEARGEEEAYVDMNCSPTQGHTRTQTIESGISEISLLPTDEETLEQDSAMEVSEVSISMEMPVVPLSSSESCSSLPNGFLCSDDINIPDFKKPHEPGMPSSPFSVSMRSSASSSCLESKSPDQSPASSVTMLFPRILRNSFSKLLTRATSISNRSKSPESMKSSLEDDAFNYIEEKKWSESDEHLEEIVSDSMQKGLPIIPFAYPNFAVANRKLEETKEVIRKNSAKDLRQAFNENWTKNPDIYPEEEEEVKEDKSLDSVVNTAKREIECSTTSPSTYVEMSLKSAGSVEPAPAKSFVLASPVGVSVDEAYMSMAVGRLPPRRTLSEDPYMRMSEDPCLGKEPTSRQGSEDSYESMSKKWEATNTLPRKARRRQSEEVFQLDGSPRKHSHPAEHINYTDKTFPRRKKRINIFNRTHEDGDRNAQILSGSLVRPFKKGNKHKDDYVFVDFEKRNYMDMAQNGTNKWKFLNFSSSSK